MRLLGFLGVSKDGGFAHEGGRLLEKREKKRGVGIVRELFLFIGGDLFDLVLFWGGN